MPQQSLSRGHRRPKAESIKRRTIFTILIPRLLEAFLSTPYNMFIDVQFSTFFHSFPMVFPWFSRFLPQFFPGFSPGPTSGCASTSGCAWWRLWHRCSGRLRTAQVALWNPLMEIHMDDGKSWNIMENHGTSWKMMEDDQK